MPWNYPDFVHVMQVYMISHAILQSNNESFKDLLRAYYSTTTQQQSSINYQTLYNAIACHGNQMLKAGVNGAWEMGATLADIKGQDISTMVKDDNVLKACFFAQILWLYANDDVTKNIIEMSILSGVPHQNLETDAPYVTKHIHDILQILKESQEYVFKACPGIDIILHLMHIRNQETYEEYCEAGFSPFN